MLKIIVTPSPILLKKSEPVLKFDKKLKEVIAEMSEALDATVDPKGVGLAAPQVGVSKRIFLAKPDEKKRGLVFVNPEIIEAQGMAVPAFSNSEKIEYMKASSKGRLSSGQKNSKKKLLEGCLSIPNIWGNVCRKKVIKISYRDENGKEHVKDFRGFSAIVIQHELDHLDGILFTKHVIEQGEQLYRSYKNEKGEDEFEEIEI
ncbi:MAG: hypothetical protein A3G66_04420 [Candidatus Levybacteria bacterium RIFCSPLOWO2_12_FULL_39_17]|uniref:Peptide deformylase n=1 Tax=Candidatus Woesebacteria bacterium GW2011_GWA1_43_12 TaxID=1618557 RepID=A0A0G1F491_9BACT|nr:MAG: peptide deformylase [Candidatus Woesebacteria bacterium GW2011_GWA1_43_12]OGH45132.1 MAG: hypothetical protein A3H82_02390 [Candidatus Levybacteria bacterium RIFCSPLOWO2_02_FULL_39_26]OGH46992.1 MAG: hypothetical protein A3G66_04420 [Candidatus Levybacteria bacterium RIFCSPLOWO2_12_FULL_39_17]